MERSSPTQRAPAASKRPGVAARPAGDVEHPPPRREAGPLQDERDRPLGLGRVAMRIELEVLLTEPLLEPFGHSRVPAPL